MLPFEIPAGTTLASLVKTVVPAGHAKLVPGSAGSDGATVGMYFQGGPSYTVEIAGSAMKVTEPAKTAVDMWLSTPQKTAQAFLDDWMGPQLFAPKFVPPSDVKLLSDPRVLRRLKMLSGKIELALRDFPGGRASLTICVGAAAKKNTETDDPDVVIETSTKTYARLAKGELAPEDALADGDVSVRGKRLVAMQLALALAPLNPKR